VLGVEIQTPEDLQFLKSLKAEHEFDFWKLPGLGRQAQIMTTNEETIKLQDILASKNILNRLLVSNVGSVLGSKNASKQMASERMAWDAYQTWETVTLVNAPPALDYNAKNEKILIPDSKREKGTKDIR